MLTPSSISEPAVTGKRSVSGEEQHLPCNVVTMVMYMSLPGHLAVATSVPSWGTVKRYVLHGPTSPRPPSPSSTPGSDVAQIVSSSLTADVTVAPTGMETGR